MPDKPALIHYPFGDPKSPSGTLCGFNVQWSCLSESYHVVSDQPVALPSGYLSTDPAKVNCAGCRWHLRRGAVPGVSLPDTDPTIEVPRDTIPGMPSKSPLPRA